MPERPPSGDDRPSDAVLDELLRAFEADDLTTGRELDLSSPEVEALLSGGQERPPEHEALAAPDEARRDGGADAEQEEEAADGAGDEVDDSGDDVTDDAAAETVVGSVEDDRSANGHDDHDHDDHRAEEGDESNEPRRVVIDADDGSDDPIYVAGDLAESEGDAMPEVEASPKVFIDDSTLEGRDAVGSPEAARASGIEPKLRERRVAVRRAEGRKRLRWVFVIIGLVVVLLAGIVVLGSSLFSIESVDVEGAEESDGEALQEIVEDLEDENIWGVDAGAYERRIERIPAVQSARVSTGFFGGATIEIKEREPVAAFEGGDGRFRVIDAEGRVLEVHDGQPIEYPLVTTIEDEEPPNTEMGSFADPGFTNAGTYAKILTPAIVERLELIAVARDGSDTRLQLRGGTEVLLGDGMHPVDKLVRLQNEIVRYDGELPARLDVSTDEVTNVPR